MTFENKKTSVLFLPETGIYPYARGLAVLGAAMQAKGYPVLLTRCTGQMPHCSMLVGHRVPLAETKEAKKLFCPACAKYFHRAQQVYGFDVVDFSELNSQEAQDKVAEIASISEKHLLEILFDDAPLGLISQYDFALESKALYRPGQDESHTALFRAHVANTYLAGFFAQKIALHFRPDMFCTFNQYSQCHMVRYIAQQSGSSYRSLTYPSIFNVDSSLFEFADKESSYKTYSHCADWPTVRDTPVPAEKAFECWQDTVFRNLGQGSHIYSAAKTGNLAELFERLGLTRDKKLIVVYTSTNDERIGIDLLQDVWEEKLPRQQVFPDQIAWLRDLRKWVSCRNDVQVVVRIHPREGKNKNYHHGSQHLEILQSVFAEPSDGFIIVWPEEPVSSYDLLELADGCVVPWSTLGLEASRLGTPVLTWVKNKQYAHDDFIQVAGSYEEYRACLTTLATRQTSLATLMRAVRYYHWRTFIPCLDMRETVPMDFRDTTIWPMPPQGMEPVIADILEGRRTAVEYTTAKWRSELPADAETQEIEANRKGFRLYVDSLFSPRPPEKVAKQPFLQRRCRKLCKKLGLRVPAFCALPPPKPFIPPACGDYTLEFAEDIAGLEEYKSRTKADLDLRILVAEDEWFVWHVSKGQAQRRMSPLLIRLGRILLQSPSPV